MRLRIKFTKNQWAKLSDIASNLGILSASSVVVPAIIDKPNSQGLILGVIATLGFWYLSLFFAKKY